LISGSYQVSAARAEFTFDGPFNVALGPSKASVNFQGTRQTYRIAGRVMQIEPAAPQPFADVTVRIGNRTTKTAADGRFELSGFIAGAYQASAEKAGFEFDGPFQLQVGPDRLNVNFEGTPKMGGRLSVPPKLGFGKVKAKTTKTLPLNLVNLSSTEWLRVDVGGGNKVFTMVAPAAPVFIPPNGSISLDVSFTPKKKKKKYKGKITFASSDPTRPNAKTNLRGKGG